MLSHHPFIVDSPWKGRSRQPWLGWGWAARNWFSHSGRLSGILLEQALLGWALLHVWVARVWLLRVVLLHDLELDQISIILTLSHQVDHGFFIAVRGWITLIFDVFRWVQDRFPRYLQQDWRVDRRLGWHELGGLFFYRCLHIFSYVNLSLDLCSSALLGCWWSYFDLLGNELNVWYLADIWFSGWLGWDWGRLIYDLFSVHSLYASL